MDKALAEETAKAVVAGAKKTPVADGHDPVSYPIKLTKVIVSMWPNVLYLDNLDVIDAPVGM